MLTAEVGADLVVGHPLDEADELRRLQAREGLGVEGHDISEVVPGPRRPRSISRNYSWVTRAGKPVRRGPAPVGQPFQEFRALLAGVMATHLLPDPGRGRAVGGVARAPAVPPLGRGEESDAWSGSAPPPRSTGSRAPVSAFSSVDPAWTIGTPWWSAVVTPV